jgi:flagellar basal body-associated protein FliL
MGDKKTENTNTELSNVTLGEIDDRISVGDAVEDAVEAVKPVRKNMIYILTILMVLLLVAFFTIVLPFYKKAKETGEDIGSTAGSLAGIAIGSLDGITNGIEEGEAAGKEQGLSAEDTRAEIETQIEATGKLEVLVVDGCQITNSFTQGDDYWALFAYNATAVFSVDLTDVTTNDDGELLIVVPNPVCEITIDETEVDELVAWQKNYWSGETEAAYEGYQNSMEQIKENAEAEMEAQFMDQAKIAAKKSIHQIANSASGGKYNNIEVTFQEEGE